MTRRPAAFHDHDRRTALLPVRPSTRPHIVATVDQHTGPLLGMDAVRIDAARGSLATMMRLRRRYSCPALLDLPGPGSGPVCSPLTTSELLVFASSERFDWVSLRGVRGSDELRRAKALLHASVRLAASVCVPTVLEEALPEICDHADAVVLDRAGLLASLGEARGSKLLQSACQYASERGLPCMVTGGLLESGRSEALPTQGDVERLGHLLAVGARYLILDDGTHAAPAAQRAVNSVRIVIDASAEASLLRAPSTRAARVAGRPTLSLPKVRSSVLDPRR